MNLFKDNVFKNTHTWRWREIIYKIQLQKTQNPDPNSCILTPFLHPFHYA